MAGLEIRVAGRADARETTEVLARAFHDDPVFAWILPTEHSRDRRLRRYFATELRHESLRYGAVEVARIDGRIAGAAVWLPPGKWSPALEMAAMPGLLMAYRSRLPIGGQYMSIAIGAHPREPHWYLAIIGVDPSRQGQGVGAALLRSRLERCDKEGSAAYLESSKVDNVPLYEHFGFRVTGALDLPYGAPVVNTMWRQPA